MNQRSADLAISAVLTLVGLAMAVRAVDYRILVENGGIGPGFMPFVAGLALAGFAGFVAARSVGVPRPGGADAPRDDAPRDDAPPAEVSQDGPPGVAQRAEGRFRVALVLGLTLGALPLSTVVGFVLAFGALVFVLLWRVERESPRLALLVASLAVLVSWLLFVRLLAVPLPGGLLGLLGGE